MWNHSILQLEESKGYLIRLLMWTQRLSQSGYMTCLRQRASHGKSYLVAEKDLKKKFLLKSLRRLCLSLEKSRQSELRSWQSLRVFELPLALGKIEQRRKREKWEYIYWVFVKINPFKRHVRIIQKFSSLSL